MAAAAADCVETRIGSERCCVEQLALRGDVKLPEGEVDEMKEESLEAVVSRLREGDPEARKELFARFYTELHGMAGNMMRGDGAGQTLQPTALVHEAFLRLLPQAEKTWEDARHFRLFAACAMRSVLVDHARSRNAVKRGRNHVRVPTAVLGTIPEAEADVLEVQDALQRLEGLDEAAARVAEMRCFGGFTHAEIAESLGTSMRSVERLWRFARAWMRTELESKDAGASG